MQNFQELMSFIDLIKFIFITVIVTNATNLIVFLYYYKKIDFCNIFTLLNNYNNV